MSVKGVCFMTEHQKLRAGTHTCMFIRASIMAFQISLSCPSVLMCCYRATQHFVKEGGWQHERERSSRHCTHKYKMMDRISGLHCKLNKLSALLLRLLCSTFDRCLQHGVFQCFINPLKECHVSRVVWLRLGKNCTVLRAVLLFIRNVCCVYECVPD